MNNYLKKEEFSKKEWYFSKRCVIIENDTFKIKKHRSVYKWDYLIKFSEAIPNVN